MTATATRPRKTVALTGLVEAANTALAADDMTRDFRTGIIAMVESALFGTNSYRGFLYLPSELDADGALREDYDPTRREYCV